MSSREKGDVPDLQLSFVFGNSVVKPQTPCTPPGNAEPQELPEYYSTETLCLSRTELKHVTDSIVKNISLKVSWDSFLHLSVSTHLAAFAAVVFKQEISIGPNRIVCVIFSFSSVMSAYFKCALYCLQYLYLEGNQISSIPGSLFISLPNLLWLDLRNNQIASLPAEIGLHRYVSYTTALFEIYADWFQTSQPCFSCPISEHF